MNRLLTFTLLSLVTLTIDASAQPLLPNGGFEQGSEPWAAFVPAESKEINVTFTVVTDTPHSGSKVARLSSDNFARHGFIGKTIKVVPGERYRIVAWVRADSKALQQYHTAGVLVRLTLVGADGMPAPGGHFHIALNNWVSRTQHPPSDNPMPVKWSKIEAVVQIPEDTREVVPSFFAWSVKGSIYYDDISFEKVTSSTPVTPLVTKD